MLRAPRRGVAGGGQSGLDAKPWQDEAVQDEPAAEKQGQGERSFQVMAPPPSRFKRDQNDSIARESLRATSAPTSSTPASGNRPIGVCGLIASTRVAPGPTSGRSQELSYALESP